MKKKTKTSSKKSKSGIKIKGTRKKFHPEFRGQEPRFDIHPDDKTDYEIGPPPDDEASKHEYPPPRNHPRFRQVWMQYIENLVARPNFKREHLNVLEILCDLFVEYDELRAFLRVKGRTYLSVGRSGEVWKFYPEVSQLTRTQSQLKEYMKMLDLRPKRDHSPDGGGGQSGEWD